MSNFHVKTHTVTVVPKGPPVKFHPFESVEEWLKKQDVQQLKRDFENEGFCRVVEVVNAENIPVYQDIYEKLLNGEIDTSTHRHDLGSNEAQKLKSIENICQIMWPSDFVLGFSDGPLHQRTTALAKLLLGDDVAFDFDMIIYKAPHTDTCTPWHSDEGYWPDMPDKRAASFWVALDPAVPDNGCMWFVPGSHRLPLRPHRPATPGSHVLMTDGISESDGKPVPLEPGSCTVHGGRTLHYTRGNTTDTQRRALIVNCRPKDMVEWERNAGFDHGRQGLKAGFEIDIHKSES